MKHIFFLILFLSVLPFMVGAQIKQQQAIVKTHGRLQDDGSVKAGRPIPDALVEIKGGAKMFSDEQGEIAFGVSASDEYSFTNISKEGYTLSDWDIIAHTLQYSETPKDILLEDLEEQKAYRNSIERKVRNEYHAKLYALEDSIDNLQQLGIANAKEIAKLRAELDESWDVAEKYVDAMTDRYLAIDFDRAEEFDRKISAYILNGELDKADSMLATKGDVIERGERLKVAQQVIAHDLEELGNDSFRKYEIAYQRMQRDSAAFYLEYRASLDRHNIEWQIEAGEFYEEILADYERALSIYQPALEYSKQHYGELHEKTANLYNNMGVVYSAQGNLSLALEYHNKALMIQEKILNPDHPSVATSYCNVGLDYLEQGNYTLALEYFEKSLMALKKHFGLEHSEVVTIYNNIGGVYSSQGNYSMALDYYNTALAIREKIGMEHPIVVTLYDNIGSGYLYQGDYSMALEYYNKALALCEGVFGLEHPAAATIFNNIGSVYSSQKNYSIALEYYNKALQLQQKFYPGLTHLEIAATYSNIGAVYSSQDNFPLAIEYYNKVLHILEKVLGTVHADVANTCNIIAAIHSNQGNNPLALEYYEKALSIQKEILEPEHPDVGVTYGNIALIYYAQGNNSLALDYFKRSLPILEKAFGEDAFSTVMVYANIGIIYYSLGENVLALEYLNKSLNPLREYLGKYHDFIENIEAIIDDIS